MQCTLNNAAGVKLQCSAERYLWVTFLWSQVEIVVSDVNDHSPTFPNTVWQLAFSEGAVPGTR